ncbi:MAG: beta-lactamase family protein [Chloroflexi bacterium]|nr:beta-lactamase family protein [Chloroflexota bacterium]
MLDSIVRKHLGDTFPACAACAYHHGEVVLHGAWGWIDPETKQIPVTRDTLFDLASVTKTFAATAFLAQVSAGRAGLDDPVIGVVPEFGGDSPRPIDGGQDPHSKERQPPDPTFAGQSVDVSRVTFRHLLTHTSGLPPWRDVYNAAGPAPLPPEQADPIAPAVRWKRAMEAIYGYPFVGQPDGRTVRYSDIGLMLLGEAAVRLSGADAMEALIGQTLGDFAPKPVYNPVRDHGIARERIAPTEDDPTWRKRRVWGEVHDENTCGAGGASSHAGLFATAETVAAFGQRWLEGASAFGITPQIWREATRQQVDDHDTRRGLGWALRGKVDSMAGELMSMNAFGHSGFTGTSLWIDPERALVVALLTNRVYPGRWHEGIDGGIHGFRRAAHDTIVEGVKS